MFVYFTTVLFHSLASCQNRIPTTAGTKSIQWAVFWWMSVHGLLASTTLPFYSVGRQHGGVRAVFA